jgi:hypothetical protein
MVGKSEIKPITHRSLGLSALCKRFQDDSNLDILELGPALGGNITFWSRFSDSIHVADLRSSLPLTIPLRETEDEERTEPQWDRLLELPEGRRFDVILTWDLLNYLELAAVASLIDYLNRFCRSGSILFTLIFDKQSMPEKPTIYRIVDEEHLSYEISSEKVVACPRHQPRTLACMIPAFSTSNSFRLRNGVIEYLFAYEGSEVLSGSGSPRDTSGTGVSKGSRIR